MARLILTIFSATVALVATILGMIEKELLAILIIAFVIYMIFQ